MQSSVKNNISLVFASVFLACAFFVPGGEVFSKQMVSLLFLIASAIILWVFQPIPVGASSMLIMVMQPFIGVAGSFAEAFSGFSSPVNFFTISSFGIALAISKTTVPKRLLSGLIGICGTDVRKLTLSYMLLTYLISTLVSDVTAVIIGVEFAVQLLEIIPDGEDKKKIGRQFLIGIPLSSLLGGTATPVGSSINVLALDLLYKHNGLEVTFIKWMTIGFPVSFITLFITWFFLVRLFRAPDIDPMLIKKYREKTGSIQAKMQKESVTVAILCATVLLWIVSSWIPVLNTTAVAVFSLTFLMLPQVNAFSWNEFSSAVVWELPLMGAATISIGNAAVSSGIIQIIVDWMQPFLPYRSGIIIAAFTALFVTAVLFFIPVGPAAVSMLAIPAYMLGEAAGVNGIMLLIIAAMFASNSSIVPLNAVMYIPFSKKYWKISEMARTGAVMSAVWILLSSLWVPFIASVIF